MKTFDWIVVGGGIAGISLCEILTREGHSVALIEQKNKLASLTTREFHEWVHTGSLYTLVRDEMERMFLTSHHKYLEFEAEQMGHDTIGDYLEWRLERLRA